MMAERDRDPAEEGVLGVDQLGRGPADQDVEGGRRRPARPSTSASPSGDTGSTDGTTAEPGGVVGRR